MRLLRSLLLLLALLAVAAVWEAVHTWPADASATATHEAGTSGVPVSADSAALGVAVPTTGGAVAAPIAVRIARDAFDREQVRVTATAISGIHTPAHLHTFNLLI